MAIHGDHKKIIYLLRASLLKGEGRSAYEYKDEE